jgi:hypothetical protein
LGALARNDQGRNGDATPKSLKVARTFDSIGRRNEGLRTHLKTDSPIWGSQALGRRSNQATFSHVNDLRPS